MADRNSKPRVFVGSSIKGLDIARHARAALTHDANVELWEDALFKSTNVPVENLLRLVQEYDFALFILHPEDKATVREEEEVTVRDNVILELGLFLGKLGRSRVFFIAPHQTGRSHRDRLYLPTDLSGITPPEYDANAPNPRSSVANSLDEFRRALKAYSADNASSGILIDTELNFQGRYFRGYAGHDVYDKDNKPLDIRGEGTLDILASDKAIRINRTNTEGRYEVACRPYGRNESSFRKLADRKFHLKFKARAEGGKHELRVVVKNNDINKWVYDEIVIVQEGSEQEFEFDLTDVPASGDLVLRLDDRRIERAPSSVTISSFRLAEAP